ncbi:leucine-rich repeat-containing protein 70 [Chanos chanos]|uniref:Leucine-rich repeat-containing protein 70 n=1 Tax=Chanos chanos TaxID=29144 RepID=A0A6J2VDL7_CHACN|nr:leucine-rich repeat-containing protein 70-like [Chanos chanos]
MFCTISLILLAFFMVESSKLCSHQCLCYDASNIVDCRSRKFTHIPHTIPHGTWFLDLRENKLAELKTTSFSGIWALQILLLSTNDIQVLQSQALSSLSFLERLDLSHNKLQLLPLDFSEGLTSLKNLQLDHNALEHLKTPSLEHLESLEKLDLSHNYIQVIDVGTFHGLSCLRYLNLAWNRLTVLQGGLLTMQQGLSILLLGHNNISSIETEALSPLKSLTFLGLEANQLESLKFKTFLNLQTLGTHLQLSENPWTCNCELHRVFNKILHVRHLHVDTYWNITCHAPHQLADTSLALVDSHLCMGETATVLLICGTVMVTVVAALVMAERKRKEKKWMQGKHGSESEAPLT